MRQSSLIAKFRPTRSIPLGQTQDPESLNEVHDIGGSRLWSQDSNTMPVPASPRLIADTSRYEEAFKVLSTRLKNSELVRPIRKFFDYYIPSKGIPVTNFRSWVLQGYLGQQYLPAVVQWSEGDKEALAIFNVAPEKVIYSTLIHYGNESGRQDGPRWSYSLLSWRVWNMEDLRILIVGVHQALSVSYLDSENVAKFFDPSKKECSEQELVPFILRAYLC